MSKPTGNDTASSLGFQESAGSMIARKAMGLLPAVAVLTALREGRRLTDAEIDALLAVEESTLSARALLIGLCSSDLITETSLRAATACWSGVLGGEAYHG